VSDEVIPDLGLAARPRWVPRDEAEIKNLIDARILRETHYLDMKRAAADHGGKEIARDLASFALHGGTLLIGVAEIKSTRT
jgi:hypothetical protein